MAPVKNGRYLYLAIPDGTPFHQLTHSANSNSDAALIRVGFPEPGKTMVYDDSQTIDLDQDGATPLEHGTFLVKVLVLSVDPYLRGKMRDPKIESYTVRLLLSVLDSERGASADDRWFERMRCSPLSL